MVNMRLLFLLCAFFLIPGCISQSAEKAVTACVSLCKSELEKGTNLSNGPCLSNNISEGWVCDVAHSPRQAVDNLPENQCPAFRENKAQHFVEVDTDCNPIKTY